ncbi:hypothetical protein KP509_19G019500 [Ceratopteris richardii]|uniref:Glycosyltransferase n=1 Tax=Ceratopteris richardii TaxID=49495 RepID=A0A8T2SLZ6_CERRI|nr:hypothetical protein KP509_19G019500 [Ceratopteris richardii]
MLVEKSAKMVHVLLVPIHLQGHLNGMLRLARYLAAQEGMLVTFVYPHRSYHLALNRNRRQAALSTKDVCSAAATIPIFSSKSLHIQVVEDGLPLDKDPDLASFAASISIIRRGVQLLLDDLMGQSSSRLSSADEQDYCFLSWPPPCCIIGDTFVPWVQDIADAAHIPRVDFWTSSAAVYSMGSRIELLHSSGILPLPKSCWVDQETKWTARAPEIDGAPGLPPFPVTELPVEFIRPESGSQPEFQFMLKAFSRVREAHAILIHTLYELERPVIEGLCAAGFPVYAVGPLPEGLSLTGTSVSTTMAADDCLRWLDAQSTSSVIYVALGTIVKVSLTEIHALALGLEASKRPFLWVLMPDQSQSLVDALPSGFLERTVDQGSALIVPWAPQTQVLAHAAVGAFFSHCGWNSTLESMLEGVPMVACPRAAEQRSNAKWITKIWKIGVAMEIKEDGSFTKEAVEIALREVFSQDGSVCYRKQAQHFKQLTRRAFEKEGSSRANMDDFLRMLNQLNALNSRTSLTRQSALNNGKSRC